MQGLDNYESVKARKKRFYADYDDGRIIVEHIKIENKEAVMKASLYKNSNELVGNMPIATGYAQEFQGAGGFANKFAWLENCEESAIGRALDNAGYATNEKCSREEMIKVAQKEKELEGYKAYIKEIISKISKEEVEETIGPLSELKTYSDFKDAYEALQID